MHSPGAGFSKVHEIPGAGFSKVDEITEVPCELGLRTSRPVRHRRIVLGKHCRPRRNRLWQTLVVLLLSLVCPIHLCPHLRSTHPPAVVALLQEAGATPAIELAFTIADGLEYIRCAQVGH